MHDSWWPDDTSTSRLLLDLYRLDVRDHPEGSPSSGTGKKSQREGPLSQQDFIRAWRNPPGTYPRSYTHPPGICMADASPVTRCLTVYSLPSYLRPRGVGEWVEQLAFLEWKSHNDRTYLKENHKGWWYEAFEAQIQKAEDGSRISDVDHWELALERWPWTQRYPQEGSPKRNTSRRRQFLSKLFCF